MKRILLAVLATMFIAGISLVLNSLELGSSLMTHMMGRNGMETNTYLTYLKEAITSYRSLGISLLITGGLGGILFAGTLLRNK